MTEPARPRLRAGDQDRDAAVAALSDHFAAGRLDHDEFTTRMDSAHRATYLDDLEPLFADLPAPRRAQLEQRAGSWPTYRPRWLPFAIVAVLVGSVLAVAHGHFPFWLFAFAAFVVMRRSLHHRWDPRRADGAQTTPYSRSPASPRPGTM